MAVAMRRLYLGLHAIGVWTGVEWLRRLAARRLMRGRLMRDVMRDR